MWGLLNLLPIYPLDGGQIAQQIFVLTNPQDAIRQSLILSVIVGGMMVAIFFAQAMNEPGGVQWQSFYLGVHSSLMADLLELHDAAVLPWRLAMSNVDPVGNALRGVPYVCRTFVHFTERHGGRSLQEFNQHSSSLARIFRYPVAIYSKTATNRSMDALDRTSASSSLKTLVRWM